MNDVFCFTIVNGEDMKPSFFLKLSYGFPELGDNIRSTYQHAHLVIHIGAVGEKK